MADFWSHSDREWGAVVSSPRRAVPQLQHKSATEPHSGCGDPRRTCAVSVDHLQSDPGAAFSPIREPELLRADSGRKLWLAELAIHARTYVLEYGSDAHQERENHRAAEFGAAVRRFQPA